MRKIVVHMQSTVNNCIANEEGAFWEPFPWGDPEQAYINDVFRAADTIVLSNRAVVGDRRCRSGARRRTRGQCNVP